MHGSSPAIRIPPVFLRAPEAKKTDRSDLHNPVIFSLQGDDLPEVQPCIHLF